MKRTVVFILGIVLSIGMGIGSNNVYAEDELDSEIIFEADSELVEEIDSLTCDESPIEELLVDVELEEESISGTCGDDLTWILDTDGVLTISGTGPMYDYDLYSNSLPEWYAYRKNVKRIEMDNAITRIGSFAFYDCSNLVKVIMPECLESIGEYTFSRCKNIETLNLSEDLMQIGDYCFYESGLNVEIKLPSKVEFIGEYAFAYTKIKTFEIPASVLALGRNAIYGCKELKEVVNRQSEEIDLPEIIDEVWVNKENPAFEISAIKNGIAVYKSATVEPGSVESISGTCGEDLIWTLDADGLMTINGTGPMYDYDLYSNSLPEWYAYRKNVKRIELDNAIIRIGSFAFYDCSNLEKVIMPECLESIGNSAFSMCVNLGGELTIPDLVKVLGENTFFRCRNIEKLNFPEELMQIGDYCFYGSGLNGEIKLPSKVKSIGEYAFAYTKIKTFEIPSYVSSLGRNTIEGCKELKEVVNRQSEEIDLPEIKDEVWVNKSNPTFEISVIKNGTAVYKSATIESGAVDSISGTCGEDLTWTLDTDGLMTINGTGPMYDYDAYSSFPEWYTYRKNIKRIEIDNAITRIGSSVFYDCSNLEKITMPECLESIGSSAFEKCIKLRGDFILPCTVKVLEFCAFRDCDNVETLNLPEELTQIEDYCFYGSGLNGEIKLPSKIKSIGEYAFAHTKIKTFEIPASVSSLGRNTIEGCQELKEVVNRQSEEIDLPEIKDEVWVNKENPTFEISTIKNGTAAIPIFVNFYNGDELIDTQTIFYKEKALVEYLDNTESSKFTGWYTSNTVKDESAKWDFNREVTNNMNLYAGWEARKYITVSLDAVGGELSDDSLCIEYEDIYGDIPTPSKTGFVFIGWFTDSIDGDEVTYDSIVNNISDHTLYAHWERILFNIELDYCNDEGDYEYISVYYGEKANLPKPTRAGYKFIGWYLDEDLYNVARPVYSDMILLAKWEELDKLSSPISNIPNNGTVISGTKIQLTADDGARIYYTMDGTIPDLESNVYSDPIALISKSFEEVIINAIAVKEGYEDSEVVSFTYYIHPISKEELGDLVIDDVPYGDVDSVPHGLWIAGINENGYAYSGSPVKPSIRVYNYKTLLKEKVDYSVSYANNKDAKKVGEINAPKVIVTGKGNYAGSISEAFSINSRSLTNDVIHADNVYAAYKGNIQKIVPKVFDNGKQLKAGKDYQVVFNGTYSDLDDYNADAFKEIGCYNISVLGIGNYAGNLDVTETITDAKMLSKVSVSTIGNQQYTGMPITLESMGISLVVKDGTKPLVEGEHYTVSYQNNVEIGTAYIVITGTNVDTEIGKYSGEKQIKFKIVGTDIKNVKFSGWNNSFYYSGEEIEQDVDLSFEDVTLTENEDYVIEYSKNTNVGIATAVYTGINGFSGSVKKTFKIVEYDIAKDLGSSITVDYESSYPYIKGGVKPIPDIKFNGENLAYGTDFTLSYKNNACVNYGDDARKLPTIVIKGKGNFTGTLTETDFTIEEQDISNMSILVPDVVYSEKARGWKSIPTITDLDGKNLKVKTDYSADMTYEYLNQTVLANGEVRGAGEDVLATDVLPIGTDIKVTVEGVLNYTGEIFGVYTIGAKVFSKAKINVKSKEYTGSKIALKESDISVKCDKDLILDVDYEIVGYINNVQKGTAIVVFKGIGEYAGVKSVKFTIKSCEMIKGEKNEPIVGEYVSKINVYSDDILVRAKKDILLEGAWIHSVKIFKGDKLIYTWSNGNLNYTITYDDRYDKPIYSLPSPGQHTLVFPESGQYRVEFENCAYYLEMQKTSTGHKTIITPNMSTKEKYICNVIAK